MSRFVSFQLTYAPVVVDCPPDAYDYSSLHSLVGDKFFDGIDPDQESRPLQECVVFLFGRTEGGKSICVQVRGFRPPLYYFGNRAKVRKAHLAREIGCRPDLLYEREVSRRNMYGFEPDSLTHPKGRKIQTYEEIRFHTANHFHKARRMDRPPPHEGILDLPTRFLDETGIEAGGWVQAVYHPVREGKVTTCEVELLLRIEEVRPFLDKEGIAPPRIATFDIECCSPTRKMPKATNVADIVGMVSYAWRQSTRDGSLLEEKHIFCVGDCDVPFQHGTRVEEDNMVVHTFESEREMLEGLRDTILLTDPDYILSYNGLGFDWPYLFERAELVGADRFFYLSKFTSKRVEKPREIKDSNARSLFVPDLHGRTHVDMLLVVKGNHEIKLPSVSLKKVAESLFPDEVGKIDLPYEKMFELLEGGSGEERRVVAEYCLQDAMLMYRISDRLQTMPAHVEMAKVTHTSFEELYTRGRMYQVINNLAWHAHREGKDKYGEGGHILNMPSRMSGQGETDYSGGAVIEPIAGYYQDKPIVVMDYNSLYPNIIRSENLCYSTLIMNPAYDNLPGLKYSTYDVAPGMTHRFVQNVPGVLYHVLTYLLNARKATKKKMANAETKELKQSLNARQAALKVAANSVYGAAGTMKTGKYYCLAVSSSVTWMGQKHLLETKKKMEEGGKATVVYGDTDSVMVYFHGADTLEDAFERGEEGEARINGDLHAEGKLTMKIEVEKVYLPSLFVMKKRYMGLMHVKDGKGEIVLDKLDVKGFETRGQCPLAKRIQTDVRRHLMARDPDGAAYSLQSHFQTLVEDKVPIGDFVLSREFKEKYKNEKQPQKHVVDRRRERGDCSLDVHDRIAYVMTEGKHPKLESYLKAEDPSYIQSLSPSSRRKEWLDPDRAWYVEKQMKVPLTNILSLSVPHLKEGTPNPVHLIQSTLQELTRQRNRQPSILGFVKKKQKVDPPPPPPPPLPCSMVEEEEEECEEGEEGLYM